MRDNLIKGNTESGTKDHLAAELKGTFIRLETKYVGLITVQLNSTYVTPSWGKKKVPPSFRYNLFLFEQLEF